MSAKHALILDFGGVLTSDLWDSVRACARREGLHDEALLDLMRADPAIHPLFMGLERGEVHQHDFEMRLAAAAGISPEGLLGRMCAELQPNQPLLDAIPTLRKSGVRVGVLSNSWGTGYFDPYAGYDLDTKADAIVLSDQVGYRKPEIAIYQLMAELLEVHASEAVFVDDVAGYLPPASQLGMAVIHHTDTLSTLSQLGSYFQSITSQPL
jgi:putative hydrolase of the HAD superfamily